MSQLLRPFAVVPAEYTKEDLLDVVLVDERKAQCLREPSAQHRLAGAGWPADDHEQCSAHESSNSANAIRNRKR